MNFREFEKFCSKNDLKIFTVHDVKVFFSNQNPLYLNLKIHRWKQQGLLKTPKRGIYYFPESAPDEFTIASRLIEPSYISLESALSHYSLIPDVSMRVSSITTKNTRKFDINGTQYKFYHIWPALFNGFEHLEEGVFIASREKAFLDYFYFKNPTKNDMLFERLNIEALRGVDFKKMKILSQKFPFYTQQLTQFLHHVVTR